MYGVLGCQLYAFAGAVCGTTSILTMVVIGFDRYNVIVKVGKWRRDYWVEKLELN